MFWVFKKLFTALIKVVYLPHFHAAESECICQMFICKLFNLFSRVGKGSVGL